MERDKQKQTMVSLGMILKQYADSFSSKSYGAENDDVDLLMDVFGITPALKRVNRQYWGRELGMCWQLLVARLFEIHRTADYGPGYKSGDDEMCDLVVAKDAIDTKYRIGSGDSGTLKKFKHYGKQLTAKGFKPVLLILRSDNLPAAIQACTLGGWEIFVGQNTFDYIKKKAGFDMFAFLKKAARTHEIKRKPTAP